MQPNRDHLDLPFFVTGHRDIVGALDRWVAAGGLDGIDRRDPHAAGRALLSRLGGVGLLRTALPAAFGGLADPADTRLLALMRETLAWHDGLADHVFATHMLGSAAVAIGGSDDMRAAVLPKAGKGEMAIAFAFGEAGQGADLMRLATEALPHGDGFVLSGEKTWVAGGATADAIVVFARTGDASGGRGVTAFLVAPTDPGVQVAERQATPGLQPAAHLVFRDCRLAANRRIGAWGEGLRIALACLDLQRTTGAAAAVGIARRALDEATREAVEVRFAGRAALDHDLTAFRLGEFATAVEAAALVAFRAAWSRDTRTLDAGRAAATAQVAALAAAERAVGGTAALVGEEGARLGATVDRLGRELRSLALGLGSSDLQTLLVGRERLARAESEARIAVEPVSDTRN